MLRFHLDASGSIPDDLTLDVERYWSTPRPPPPPPPPPPLLPGQTRSRESCQFSDRATGWTTRGAISSRVKGPLSESPDCPWGPPSLVVNATAVSSPGCKWAGREPPSSVEGKSEWSCTWYAQEQLSPLHGASLGFRCGGHRQSQTADRGWYCVLDLGEGITTSYSQN